MNREKAHSELDELLDLIEATRQTNEEQAEAPEWTRDAAQSALGFIGRVAGPELLFWLMDAGHAAIPGRESSQTAKSPGKHDPDYIKRALARLVLDMEPVLERALMCPQVVARDLIEMSLADGSSPKILSPHRRTRGHKDNRDLRAAARVRFSTLIFMESGFRSEAPVKVFFDVLSFEFDPDADYYHSRKRSWQRISRSCSEAEVEGAIEKGKSLEYSIIENEGINMPELYSIANMQ